MTKVDVDSILQSVLKDSASSKRELGTYMQTKLANVVNNLPEEPVPTNSSIQASLIVELSAIIIEREMAIYENVATTLKRVIDELQANEEPVQSPDILE